jgi:ABC-type transport system involved in multi-copper enzyme maturation permease subunit
MLKLLKIEWLKVKYYKAFWIFLALYVVALYSINYIVYQLQDQIKKGNVPLDIFPYNYPRVYQTISWASSWLLYFPGMLMILIISNEYSFKTHRQNIIDGLTRREFVVSKILVGLVICVLTTLICFIIAVYFGVSFSGKFSFDGVEFIGYSFIQTACYLFFAMILAVLLRRSGLAMAVFFLYGLVFEQLIGGIVDNKVINSHHFFYYMPLQSTDVLIPITFGKDIFYADAPSSLTLVIIACIYISLYCFLSIKKFETDDL